MTYDGYSRTRTLSFGGPGEMDPVIEHPVRPVPGRSAAKRAKQRRRAAQRRLRVRRREGSEPLLAFLLVVGLTLMLVDVLTSGAAYGGVRSVVGSVVAPLQAGVSDAVDPAQADPALVAENQRLRSEAAASPGDRARLQELESLFGLASRSGQRVVAASVVALDSGTGTHRSAVIDRGTADGIDVDQAVLSGAGLFGKIESTTESSAVVRMVTDPSFVAGVRVSPSGEAGILRGTGDAQALTVELLNPIAKIERGDTVVTFGSPGDRPFPPGIAVGTVAEPGESAQPGRTVGVSSAAQTTSTSVVAVVVAPSQPETAPTLDPAVAAAPAEPAAAAPAAGDVDGTPPDEPSTPAEQELP